MYSVVYMYTSMSLYLRMYECVAEDLVHIGITLCLFVCVCMCVHAWMCSTELSTRGGYIVFVCMCMYMCVYIRLFVYVYVCIFSICMNAQRRTQHSLQLLCVYVCVYVFVYMCMWLYSHFTCGYPRQGLLHEEAALHTKMDLDIDDNSYVDAHICSYVWECI